jgi:acetolactate decarboxylase
VKKYLRRAIIYLIGAYFVLGCSVATENKITNQQIPNDRETLYQVSTISALFASVYEGEKTFAEVKEEGDFGIGIMNKLNGEMIALDGQFYQLKVDGQAYPVADWMKTSFAAVTFFDMDDSLSIEDGPVGLEILRKSLDALIPNKRIFYAIRIDGEFEFVKTRSFLAQEKPYRRFSLILKSKQQFQRFESVKGTMVGFWTPKYVSGVKVSGYHFHFITQDRTRGGHVLDCKLVKGKVEIDSTPKIHIELLTKQGSSEKAAGQKKS